MLKLLIVVFVTVILGSCASPMERAQDICNQLGNTSSACVERQFNVERARDDAFFQRQRAIINSGSPPSLSQPPTESEYDRRVREFEGQAKNNCEMTGGVYEQFGNASTCGPPK